MYKYILIGAFMIFEILSFLLAQGLIKNAIGSNDLLARWDWETL